MLELSPYERVGISATTPLFHGGAPGLGVGDVLIAEVDLAKQGRSWGGPRPGFSDLNSVVYTSTDRELARAFATRTDSFAGGGCVYRVRPVPASSLAIDPDFPTVGLTCARAEVVEVVARHVLMHYQEVVQAFAPHLKWEDGRRVYTDEGFMTPAPNWVGVTERQARRVGRWTPVDAVLFHPDTGALVVNEGMLR